MCCSILLSACACFSLQSHSLKNPCMQSFHNSYTCRKIAIGLWRNYFQGLENRIWDIISHCQDFSNGAVALAMKWWGLFGWHSKFSHDFHRLELNVALTYNRNACVLICISIFSEVMTIWGPPDLSHDCCDSDMASVCSKATCRAQLWRLRSGGDQWLFDIWWVDLVNSSRYLQQICHTAVSETEFDLPHSPGSFFLDTRWQLYSCYSCLQSTLNLLGPFLFMIV